MGAHAPTGERRLRRWLPLAVVVSLVVAVTLGITVGDALFEFIGIGAFEPYWARRRGAWNFPFVGIIGVAPVLLVAVGVLAIMTYRYVTERAQR